MSPILIEQPLIVVSGLPAAGKTTLVRRRWNRVHVGVVRVLRDLLSEERTWYRAREVVAALAGGDAASYWSAPGLDNLRLAASPTLAAAIERRLTRFVIRHVSELPRQDYPLIVEATPVAALAIVEASLSVHLVLVQLSERIRIRRLAARLTPDHARDARGLARFQSAAHHAALQRLRASVPHGWGVTEEVGDHDDSDADRRTAG